MAETYRVRCETCDEEVWTDSLGGAIQDVEFHHSETGHTYPNEQSIESFSDVRGGDSV